MRGKFLTSALLLALASTAFAQTAAPAKLTAEQQAAQTQMNQKLANAGLQVAQLIDAGKAGEVWDGASPIAKQASTRAAFIKQTNADRKTVGPLTSRAVQGVNYQSSDGKKLPAGIYASVAFASKFASTKAPVRELISFHLESNKTWLVTGYTLR
ncbi:DUF4019 domain-containing protein [Rhodanobacter sp. L36]|uniref:DUF4019 domain-containing protein n=1 Tax=Rhodanobacter sp. L36 TaxID=1747221 RepID=UPI00131CF88D|nr:DUF4019 domain-containing protein [Rhodanobacter sp. L36]